MKTMKTKIKKGALVLMTCCMMFSTVGVSAATISTSEFGNFTYSLERSGSTVTAVTKTSKVANKLITKLEVQVNATGETIVSVNATRQNATDNTIVKATNYTTTKLAAFSTHEARGTGSVAKYLAEVF